MIVEGALWNQTSGKGAEYMTGSVEIDGKKIKIVCFKNSEKKGKQPDWRILESKPKVEVDIAGVPPQAVKETQYPEEDTSQIPF